MLLPGSAILLHVNLGNYTPTRAALVPAPPSLAPARPAPSSRCTECVLCFPPSTVQTSGRHLPDPQRGRSQSLPPMQSGHVRTKPACQPCRRKRQLPPPAWRREGFPAPALPHRPPPHRHAPSPLPPLPAEETSTRAHAVPPTRSPAPFTTRKGRAALARAVSETGTRLATQPSDETQRGRPAAGR